MASAVGDPNVSLLPQPANPVPIEPMRGGGGLVGGGSESVSLLPQPVVAAPIEPMRGGGGPEDVSLLPQPAVEAPIIPMKGGGDFPQARLITYGRRNIVSSDIPDTILLKKNHVENYYNVREYNYESKHTKKKRTDPAILPGLKTFEVESIQMDANEIIYIFFVQSLVHFFQIELKMRQILKTGKLKTDNLITFLFINQSDPKEFQKIYRSFIIKIADWDDLYNNKEANAPIVEYPNVNWFFLFDKQKLNIVWQANEPSSKGAPSIFDYIEPDLVSLNYKVGGEEKTVGIVPAERPKDNKDPLIGPDQSEDTFNLVKGTKFDLRTLVPEKYYTTKKVDTKYWDSKFIQIDFSGELTIEEEAETVVSADATAAAASASASAAAASPPPGEDKGKDKAKQPPPPEKPKVTFIVSAKKTITLDLGGQYYEIRIPNDDVRKAWNEGTFEPEEIRLFEALGLTKEFFANNGYEEERKYLYTNRGELLWYLTATGCMKETSYLLTKECRWMRDALQKLLEIRQFDRLRAISSALGSAEDFEAELQKAAAKRESTALDAVDKFFRDILKGLTVKKAEQVLTPDLLAQLMQVSPIDPVSIDTFFGSILDLSTSLRKYKAYDPSKLKGLLGSLPAGLVVPPPP